MLSREPRRGNTGAKGDFLMEFKKRTLKEIADMICGNFKAEESFFKCRSSAI